MKIRSDFGMLVRVWLTVRSGFMKNTSSTSLSKAPEMFVVCPCRLMSLVTSCMAEAFAIGDPIGSRIRVPG